MMDPEGKPAKFGAGPAVPPQTDFEAEDGIRGRAPEGQPVRVQGGRGKVAGEWRSVARVKPDSGVGMEGW
jgi:hypothetical protein